MLEKLIELLDKISSKTIIYQEVLMLSNLLWIYHRQVAKQRSIDTARGWRFMQLVDKFDYVEFQRGWIDIVKDMLRDHNSYTELDAIYLKPIDNLKTLLLDYIKTKWQKDSDSETK